jgi:hypothetical protein
MTTSFGKSHAKALPAIAVKSPPPMIAAIFMVSPPEKG